MANWEACVLFFSLFLVANAWDPIGIYNQLRNCDVQLTNDTADGSFQFIFSSFNVNAYDIEEVTNKLT